MSTCGLALLALHFGALLVDSFMPFSIAQIAIPMASEYRPIAVAFGIVAMYATVFVIVASWMRSRIGTTWWRRTHLLAVPTFALSLVHGVFSGTDSREPWMFWIYVVTGLFVLFLVVVRGLTAGYRPSRAPRPEPRVRPAAGEHPVPATVPAPAAEG